MTTKCKARQHSDQMICSTCGLIWDTNDTDPPTCRGVNFNPFAAFATPVTPWFDVTASTTRVGRILGAIYDNPGMLLKDIAAKLGESLRDCRHALGNHVNAGRVVYVDGVAVLTEDGVKWVKKRRPAQADGKKCTVCETVKPKSEFWGNVKNGDGLSHRCKRCAVEYNQKRRAGLTGSRELAQY